MDMGLPFYSGAVRFHPFQFGLPEKADKYTPEDLEQAAACGLQRAFERGGFLMLVEPSRVQEQQIQDWLSGTAFANRLAARMDRLALASGRLEDTHVAETLMGIPVHFYLMKPGQDLPVVNCPP
jgi:hypothetical protein